ncbi:O-antigen export system permease protein [Leucobacter sp. 7(1)]|uniref:ABC transporter permease n=1 Tax=Leucobacter sp. 7(1) TaxID=1255613 RepID=UPI00097E850D|nr:ABC transporter permease [Leucobacter sp. 7(1)]SJN11872.1 O-antigen export system permease protein [Leucobacter sp. 7(1)]
MSHATSPTNSPSSSAPNSPPKYVVPGASRWLFDAFRYRHLLTLLLKKGTTTRYYGSVLGWAWSYVKPAAQFLMYYVMIGLVLKVDRGVELYPVYLFSGIVLLNFFSEATRAATNSITSNAALVKKIYLPRELFPVAAVGSAFIHFIPQVILLFVVCLIMGWHFTWLGLVAFLVALVIVTLFTLGLGLFFGAINVAYRDAKNIIDVALMFAVWASPVLYTHEMIRELVPAWLYNLYLVNPMTVGVELFHQAFWGQVVSETSPPDYLLTNTLAGLGIALGTLLIGQVVFRKLEGNFAQDL